MRDECRLVVIEIGAVGRPRFERLTQTADALRLVKCVTEECWWRLFGGVPNFPANIRKAGKAWAGRAGRQAV